MALSNPRPLPNPLVGRVDFFGEVVVRDDVLGKIRSETDDLRAAHIRKWLPFSVRSVRPSISQNPV